MSFLKLRLRSYRYKSLCKQRLCPGHVAGSGIRGEVALANRHGDPPAVMAGHARSVSMAGPSPAGRRPQARKLVADPRNNRISEMPGRLLPPQAMALRGGFRSRYRWTSRDVYHSIKVTAYLPGTLYNTVTIEISKLGFKYWKTQKVPTKSGNA